MELKLYIANVGKYVEGELVGDWIELPFSDEELSCFLSEKVGINAQYEEYVIHDIDTSIKGLDIGEYTNLEHLNNLYSDLYSMNDVTLDLVNAILESKYYGSDIKALEQIIDNIENFSLVTDVFSELDTGYYYIQDVSETKEEDIDTRIYESIDFEELGRRYIQDSNHELTSKGLLLIFI